MKNSSKPSKGLEGGATIRDVAMAAGVSTMTASRALSGKAPVGAVKREKVIAAAHALNYQVNLAARAARLGSSRVGLLYSNPSASFLSDFLVGAMEECSQGGAQLILERCDSLCSQRNAIDKLIANGVDGILVPPPLCDSRSALKHLDEIGMPTVAVATARPSHGVSAVRIDDYEGALTMVRYLLSLGHTDIAFIKGDPKHTPAQLRLQAFSDGMAEAGLTVAPARVVQASFTYRSGLDAARQLLGRGNRPTAIFASNDEMAAAVIAVAHGLHLRVPNDLTVCGFDDTAVATTVWPTLTTVHQPIANMARAAVKLLLEQMRRRRRNEAPIVQHNLMPYTLVRRQSSARLTRTR